MLVVIISISDRHSWLVDTFQRGLMGNTTVGIKGEALNAIIPTSQWTSFHELHSENEPLHGMINA
jgi:hypothetical protein